MKLKLDQFDKKILLELDKNARITTSKIGKKIKSIKTICRLSNKKIRRKQNNNKIYQRNRLHQIRISKCKSLL